MPDQRRAQQLAFAAGEAVALVQYQDQRPLQRCEPAQGIQLGLGQVAVDHEQDQIGATGHLVGQLLPFLAVDFIDPRGVDQKDVAVTELAPLPVLHRAGLAMQRAGREALFAE